MREGTVLNQRYKLEKRLGAGGQGSVWSAFDSNEGQTRAIKVIDPADRGEDAMLRAMREAEVVTKLDHPAIVKCYAVERLPGEDLLFLVFEFVEANVLSKAEEDPRFTAPQRRAALRQLAAALAYLHKTNVVHRDLKPDNVLVTSMFWEDPAAPGGIKLIDFGIASPREGRSGDTLSGNFGTPQYMAPELVSRLTHDETPSLRSPGRDVFAFGVIGWELLAGKHPTGLPSSANLGAYAATYESLRRGKTPWPPPMMSGSWGAVLTACLSVDPARRPRDGAAIERLLSNATATPVPGSVEVSLPKGFGAEAPQATAAPSVRKGFGAEGAGRRPAAPSVRKGFGAEAPQATAAPSVRKGFGAEGAGRRPAAPSVEKRAALRASPASATAPHAAPDSTVSSTSVTAPHATPDSTVSSAPVTQAFSRGSQNSTSSEPASNVERTTPMPREVDAVRAEPAVREPEAKAREPKAPIARGGGVYLLLAFVLATLAVFVFAGLNGALPTSLFPPSPTGSFASDAAIPDDAMTSSGAPPPAPTLTATATATATPSVAAMVACCAEDGRCPSGRSCERKGCPKEIPDGEVRLRVIQVDEKANGAMRNMANGDAHPDAEVCVERLPGTNEKPLSTFGAPVASAPNSVCVSMRRIADQKNRWADEEKLLVMTSDIRSGRLKLRVNEGKRKVHEGKLVGTGGLKSTALCKSVTMKDASGKVQMTFYLDEPATQRSP